MKCPKCGSETTYRYDKKKPDLKPEDRRKYKRTEFTTTCGKCKYKGEE